MKTKIQMTDSTMDMMVKMSEGNPGALTVCMRILQQTRQIDPDNALEGLGPIFALDTLNLYGSKIWMLYKDVCGEDVSRMLALLRGNQLGFVTDEQIQHAVENYGEGIDLSDVCKKVTDRLPNFNLEAFAQPPTRASEGVRQEC